MRLTAAIPMLEASVPHLPVTLQSLHAQGFDEVLLLWMGEGKLPTVSGDIRSVRVHPDFTVEAATHEASTDWVFVIYPGEYFEHGDLKNEVSKLVDVTWIGFGDRMRGFRRNGIANGGLEKLTAPVLVGTGLMPDVKSVEVSTPTLPLTVILPTWRLGGLDVTFDALAKQTFKDFELVIVDALYQWRADEIKWRFGKYEFPIAHIDVDDSIFPVSCHSRFRNTAIRRAKGKRVVFLSEYAVPPPEFLAQHAALPDDAIGLAPWLRTTINPKAIKADFAKAARAVPDLGLAEACRQLSLSPFDVLSEVADRDGWSLWSVFNGENPFGEVIDRFPQNPQANFEFGTQEYLPHYKSDSVPLSLCRLVNGWDESFDGRGDCADVDFSLRLLWSGARIQLLDVECPVLDAHVIASAPLSDGTRNNRNRLVDTRVKRMVRCVFGLTHGIVND